MSTMQADLEMVTWLRQQIEARRDLALRITAPRPHLRDSGARLSGEWQTGCTCKAECRDYPSCDEVTGDGIHIYSEGGHDADQAAHIAANDPRDTIARCEAELAILDLHAATRALVDKPPRAAAKQPEAVKMHAQAYGIPEAQAAATLISARDYMDALRELCILEEIVRLLASGYRHRPGWKEEWEA